MDDFITGIQTAEGVKKYDYGSLANLPSSVTDSTNTVISPNADYAEVGEWADGNTGKENRLGYFIAVAEVGDNTIKIRKATSHDDVRGVSVYNPAFSGNASEDKYGQDGELLPQYNYVGIMGIIPVIDNGRCTVNGRCMPADDGTAVPSTNNMGYAVLERVDATRVLIAVEPAADMVQRIKTDMEALEALINSGGGSGSDGVSPTVEVTTITGGHRIYITDKNGTKTVDVMDGVDGTSVTVKSVSESTASGGTNTVTYSDGKKINIKNGADGKDYVLTDADRAEMVAMVLEAIGGNPIYGYIDENYHIVLSGNMPDGTYTASYEDENGSIVSLAGQLVKDTNVYYSVTSNLTNCTNSNGTKTVVQGGSYSATISANSGYELESVVVTMGGSPVSVSGGVINIASVTGDIVITAVAEEIQISYIQCEYIENSDQDSYVDLGYTNTESTGIQIEYEYVTVSSSIGNSGGVGIMGNGDIAIGNMTYAGGDLRAYWGGVKSYQLKDTTAENTEYTAGMNYLNSGKGSIDGTDKNMNSGTKTFAKNETIMLCRQNGNKNFKNNGLIRVKEIYISEGTSVAKHYVPAYRNTDGAIGMLETNSNEFIVATGTFTKGADVEGTGGNGGTNPDNPDSGETTSYTNQIPISTDASGNPFNGGQGWKTGYRLSGSSGNESAQEGTEVTGFIPVKYGDTVYLKDITDDGTRVIGVYKSDYSFLASFSHKTAFGGAIGGEAVSFVVNGNLNSSLVSTSGIAFMRVSATEITADSIITVNEPIE